MPIQINEVIIRTTVDNVSGSTAGSETAAPVNREDDDALEKIIEIIKEKNER